MLPLGTSTLYKLTVVLSLASFAHSTTCNKGYSPTGPNFQCVACLPGTYSDRGAGCSICPWGTGAKTAATSAEDCGTCPNGTFTVYLTGCVTCPAGAGSLSGAMNCYSCPVGTYNDRTGLGTTNDGCHFCPAGTGVGPGTTLQKFCGNCPKGVFSLGDGKGCVHKCDPGTGSNTAASSQATCGSCPGGTYSIGDGKGCVPCPAGQGSSPGSTSCTDCPANMWSNVIGSGCQYCVPGRVSPPASKSASSCIACPAGQTTALGGPCTDCPAGTYAPWAGSQMCHPCPAGRASIAGSAGCCTCCNGFYSAQGAGSCTKCAAGTSGPGSQSSHSCGYNPSSTFPAVQSCDIISKTSCPPTGPHLASGIPSKKKRGIHCRKSFTACPHLSGQGGWDCIDTKHNPEMCGGCVGADGEGTGKDCTSIPDVGVVSCKKSKCVIENCRKGFEKTDDGRRCVRAVASGLLGLENTAANLFFPYAPLRHP